MPKPCLSHLLTRFARQCTLLPLAVLVLYTISARGMTGDQIAHHRQEARSIFYHGFTNYHEYAFPDDELRPLTCTPLARDRENPAHIEVNDVLGNYSLSLVDSLSTLAILASRPTSDRDPHDALHDFQENVKLLVQEYGDGSAGPRGQGRRARAFDLDSKVQVFETTIRGVGGLLSAHLFAVGDLPIKGYNPVPELQNDGAEWITWDNRSEDGDPFVYDGQLLRLAYDLGLRLLPAFHTPTEIPYPRVNLRHGVAFYQNSPLTDDAEHGQCDASQGPTTEREITENCSAGAGSLVLEFTVLSRLTGDTRFELAAKKAFWAIWDRRTTVGLIGAGIDAETGQWSAPYTGIGAGIDSFFEYSFKSHILLSGTETYETEHEGGGTSASFLWAWETAHASIKRHIYRGPEHQHPHYAQNDMWTGGPRLGWIDSLSAYYPGLLVLAGELEEATAAHLLYTALWTRYGALPERWNTFSGKIDGGIRWWGGRPEFIESTWYLYRATRDPWYLYIGEMVIKDISRRCWTPCGWAGLQDVRTGEQIDRMESFFLGETAKYLYLLFDPDHPLNHLDAPFVFTTEGHPLVIPERYMPAFYREDGDPVPSDRTCPVPPEWGPFGTSAVSGRGDVFHASTLARLYDFTFAEASTVPVEGFEDLTQNSGLSPNSTLFYPWTLPQNLVPWNATCDKMVAQNTFDLTFPVLLGAGPDFGALTRIEKGILVKSISGLRLALVGDEDHLRPGQQSFRIGALSGLALGRDEGIYLSADVVAQLHPGDPNLSIHKDTGAFELLVDAPASPAIGSSQNDPLVNDAQLIELFTQPGVDVGKMTSLSSTSDLTEMILDALPESLLLDASHLASQIDDLDDLSSVDLDQLINFISSSLQTMTVSPVEPPPPRPRRIPPSPSTKPTIHRHSFHATLPTGPGAASLPSKADPLRDPSKLALGHLPHSSIYLLDSDLCTYALPAHVPRNAQILVVRRGGCSFADKLENIPAYPPGESSLFLVVAISFELDGPGAERARPFIERAQKTKSGVERRNGITLSVVDGGEKVWDVWRRAAATVGVFGKDGVLRERRGENKGGGAAVKRKWWFACNGVRIANLFAA